VHNFQLDERLTMLFFSSENRWRIQLPRDQTHEKNRTLVSLFIRSNTVY